MRRLVLNRNHEKYLAEIGLSRDAIKLYELILQRGPLTIQQAASHTYDHPSAHYRLFYKLENYDLVRRTATRPQKFEALTLQTGLWASFVKKQTELAKLLKQSGMSKKQVMLKEPHQPELIVGRQDIDDKYAQMAAKAKEEILIYAIGIAFSDRLLETQLKAIRRKVAIRHLVQQANPQNYHVIRKWRQAGVEIRHLSAERGLHFYIMDRKQIVIVFSDPDNTDNRLGILTDNPAAISLFVSNFEDLWAQAREIKW